MVMICRIRADGSSVEVRVGLGVGLGVGWGWALTWLKDTCSWQMGQLWLRNLSAEGRSALSCTASITSTRLKRRSGMDMSSRRLLARSGGS